jgi:succinyl-diaminopimelate desuccinylase
VDIRFLPGQDPQAILEQIARIPSIDVTRTFIFPPVSVPRGNQYVQALRDAVTRSIPEKEVLSVGRDGASDAVAFMAAGIPAVEFGPDGAGHHGPEEYVSVSSMARYRRSLVGFVRALPIWLERPAADEGRSAIAVDAPPPALDASGEDGDSRGGLTAIDGGLR